MDTFVSNNIEQKEAIKNKIIDFLEKNDISYNLLECCNCDRICLDFNSERRACKKYCCNTEVSIIARNKEPCRIYPYEILYIAIENRKTVVYLRNKKIETNYPFSFWKNILDSKSFAQPHNSYIVNLMYVEEVTKEFVFLKYRNKEYQVYTSSRKLSRFKKALLDFHHI